MEAIDERNCFIFSLNILITTILLVCNEKIEQFLEVAKTANFADPNEAKAKILNSLKQIEKQ